ncbi:hypothetical protein M413DRAFT_125490 [Hebeloma cylindrosporum]|uniref:PNPLA domain-containing protein n=1 Tax=Hebeloma cylindrosporum TaxID=76867 RepID=A0A0C3CFE4_HEBCY|nr:hypothetical protein M413DRAFT_125490 [Hebeloma cylindrosporum h7]
MGKVARILSLDGCGFRGRVQLLVLDELMKRMQASDPSTYPVTPRPCEVFDLICGTATGGLIAILVGRLGMSCSNAIAAYDQLEEKLFSGINSLADLAATLASPNAFNTDSFRQLLQTLVQNNADTSVQPATERLFMQANDTHTRRCKTFVTVVSANAVDDKDAYRIRSYADPKPVRDPEIVPGHRWQIWEAAVGTVSCPRLFSPFELQAQSLFQAANASGFSNPSMIAYTEALDLFGNDAEVTLVSLGMGLRNRHDYSSPTVTSIDDMIASLGSALQNQIQEARLRNFVAQTQLVATGTRIKDLRVADRIRRAG